MMSSAAQQLADAKGLGTSGVLPQQNGSKYQAGYQQQLTAPQGSIGPIGQETNMYKHVLAHYWQ